jgi:Heterokaryon incompatibility protein (HET)
MSTCDLLRRRHPAGYRQSVSLAEEVAIPCETRVLWADAICINQDNLAERAEQVTFMRYISEGPRVLIWLGEERTHTRESIQTIPLLTKAFNSLGILPKTVTRSLGQIKDPSEVSSGAWLKELVSTAPWVGVTDLLSARSHLVQL